MRSEISSLLFLTLLLSFLPACKTPEIPAITTSHTDDKINLIVQDVANRKKIREDDLNNHFDTSSKKLRAGVFPKSYALLARENSRSVIDEVWIQPSDQEALGYPLNRVDILIKEAKNGDKCTSIYSFANDFELSIQPPNPLHRQFEKSQPVVAEGSVSGHRTIATTEGFSGGCLREISIFFVD